MKGLFKRVLLAALAVLLLAVLVGPSGAAGETATQPRTVTKVITIPAAAFSATQDGVDFVNWGRALYTASGIGAFTSPVLLESRDVTVNDVTLYTYDNNTGEVCLRLYRTNPLSLANQEMGSVCSSGASTTDPRVFTMTPFAYRKITGSHGPYLYLYLPGSAAEGYVFYAVRIKYTYTP